MTGPMPARWLFLDFEGVLTPQAAPPGQRFSCAPRLAEALQDAPPTLKVVIASTWRRHRTVEQLRAMLPAPLAARVVGTTGASCEGLPHPRWHEIDAWLRAAGERGAAGADWRALDDSPWLFPPGCPQLVACDGRRGVQRAQLEMLRAWWGGG